MALAWGYGMSCHRLALVKSDLSCSVISVNLLYCITMS